MTNDILQQIPTIHELMALGQERVDPRLDEMAGNQHHDGALSQLTLDQAQVLICTANSTGGVMGKMIDAQSICVATAGTNQIGREADLFKAVIGHSIFLACVVGTLTALQAFVSPFTHMVPEP